ncbi:MAG: molybdenum ABC transporter ATP-binding protein [Burkholderiales bacterium]|nr:molybdenum ABC transporter ATP-binding protein [Burkholderiales bacterium]
MIEARLHLQRSGGFALAVDLQLPGQGVSALFGASGCGKTTLLRALAGLERATGRVVLAGEVWQDDASGCWLPTHRRALGYVIQEAALFPHLDVQRNLHYGLRRAASAEQRIALQRALDQAVALLGIGGLMSRRPATLSGGERQRVAIARALATRPRLLLMDEPLAALDATRKAEILPYLERLHRELALPIVYVTHAMDEVARLADHLVLLEAGRVRAAGPLAELLSRVDLPLGRQDEAGVVIEAELVAHDAAYALSRIAFAGGALWLGAAPQPIGERVRARVLARDVSVTRTLPGETSILNVLPVRLEALHADAGTALLRLRVGHDEAGPAADGVHLLARITRKSCEALRLAPGDALFAQVKGVALM